MKKDDPWFGPVHPVNEKEIFAYTMAEGFCVADFIKAVNEKLKDGWEVYGYPITKEKLIIQPMVKLR
jgi:hypothetical protein